MVKKEDKQFDLHVIGRFLFAIYLALLTYMMFFAESLGRNLIIPEYRYNLVPFREIRRCIEFWDVLGPLVACANLVGNIVAFVPLGMFLPYVWKPGKKWYIAVLTGLLSSLMIETLQLLSHRGSFDVDDLLLNTTGAVIGYAIYHIMRKLEKNRKNKTV